MCVCVTLVPLRVMLMCLECINLSLDRLVAFCVQVSLSGEARAEAVLEAADERRRPPRSRLLLSHGATLTKFIYVSHSICIANKSAVVS